MSRGKRRLNSQVVQRSRRVRRSKDGEHDGVWLLPLGPMHEFLLYSLLRWDEVLQCGTTGMSSNAVKDVPAKGGVSENV